MSIKDLFGKTSEKNLTAQDVQKLYDEAESEGYLNELAKDNDRFLPHVDFSSASNFARYGSAEKYYADAIKNIYERYPYDGSRKEKQEWRNNSSQFDLYVYDNIYPKTTGYVSLGSASWNQGTVTSFGAGGVTYKLSSIPQYVYLYGGPHTASSGKFADANLYDTASNRGSNLAINPLNYGNTVEFWFKETADNSTGFALFDLWNGQAFNAANYTRFLIERISTDKFHVTYCSGSSGVTRAEISTTIDRYNWHHYAFAVENSGSSLKINLYVDGDLNKSILTGTAVSEADNNSAVAYIGAYRTSPISQFSTGSWNGRGSVYGSFDEFRFWKESRSPKKLSRYWFTQVGGGSNTDDSNTELGVYYKFNEGIISTETANSLDSKCLDYSGRISNGIIKNYTVDVRSAESAINTYSSDFDEPKDPILYLENALLNDTLLSYTNSGSLYDETNNSNIYKSLPSWITEEQEAKGGEDLSNLVQIISSYFDTLHIQIENLPRIKDIKYVKDSEKPLPFINKILSSYDFQNLDIFNNTTFLEEILSRSETDEFEKSLADVKNTIYQNIYNNLSYIYKSKGTEKSLRNLIRCFGVDDELVKINLYADNATYDLETKYQYTSYPKKFVDFNNPDRYEGFIYQKAIAGDSSTRGYILGNNENFLAYIPVTLQSEIIFPKKVLYDNPNYNIPEFTTVSLFGAHKAKDDENDLTWGNDEFKIVVTAEKRNFESPDVYFKVSGSLADMGFQLTSSWFNEVYDNQKWNLAVRIKHSKYNNADFVFGSNLGDYVVEFFGVNSTLDSVDNSFSLSTPITNSNAQIALSMNKRVYAGAHYTDFNESYPIAKSDVKISSVRFWLDYLTDEEIKHHSYDASSFGRKYPHWNSYLDNVGSAGILTKADTLALNWDFNQVTSSDSNGQFIVEDASSGSLNDYYNAIAPIIKYRHTGFGTNFFPNDTQTVNKEYVFSAKLQTPEVFAGSDLIQIRNTDDVAITRAIRPTTYFHAVEKSMSSVINDEILSWFATIDAYNNLIGEPLERYRRKYKNLEHLRKIFFDKVKNTPDYEKFIEFYKWIDSSISLMLFQLIPASANVSSNVRNVVESHLLERNKYENKLPTIEAKSNIVAITSNTQRLVYQDNRAPSNPTGSLWLKLRANRTDPSVTSGDAVVDASREAVRQVVLSKNLNKSPKQYDIATSAYYEGKKDFARGYSRIYDLSGTVLQISEKIINPINIANNLIVSDFQFASASITGSGQIFTKAKTKGNYSHTYEYVQTSGRTDNNKAFPDLVDGFGAVTSSTYVSGVVDRLLPERSTVKTVFVERFSAPGGPEVSSRGGMEQTAEELSVYNSLNNRNAIVRRQLNKWLGESASYDNDNPSLHKVNKNAGYTINDDGTTNVQYDNEFIQRQIPRSDAQYSWLTASLISKPSASGFFSQYDNLNIYNTGSAQFLSGTLSGSSIIDYVGLNNTITTTVNTAQNLLSTSTSSLDLNKYLLNTNGPYGYPSWKQIRQGNKRIVRDSVKNNEYIIQNPVKPEIIADKFNILRRIVRKNSLTFTRYKEPPVSYNKPMDHTVEVAGSPEPVQLVSTYENNKEKFANEALTKVLGTKERTEPQTHDIITNLETGIFEPKPKIKYASYKENIYPNKSLIGLKDVRTKPNYEDDVGNTGSVVNARTFWRDVIEDREREDRTVDLFEFTTSSYDILPNENVFFAYNKNANLFGISKINPFKKSIFSQDSYSDYIEYQVSEKQDVSNGIAIYLTQENKFVELGKNSANNTWQNVFSNNASITAFASSSEGVYVGGSFVQIGPSNNIDSLARWDGTQWNSVGSTLGPSDPYPQVYSFISSSEGLYVGGEFTDADGTVLNANGIARWDGTQWNRVSPSSTKYFTGPAQVFGIVSSSEGLYAAGNWYGIAGYPTPTDYAYIARWDGSEWNSLLDPATYAGGVIGIVQTIFSGSDGVYIAGDDLGLNFGKYTRVAKWNGSQWNTLLTASNAVAAPTIFSIYSASSGVYIGGHNGYGNMVENVQNTNGIAKWDGNRWSALKEGIPNAFTSVRSIIEINNKIYIGGDFSKVDDNPLLNFLIIWNGEDWESLPDTVQGNAQTLYFKDNKLYIGGQFYALRSQTRHEIFYNKKINGDLSPKSILEERYLNSSEFFINYKIQNLAKYLIKENSFYSIENTLAQQFAESSSSIQSIISGSDGIYVGGVFFSFKNNSNLNCIARWDGSQWNALGNGLNNTASVMFSASDGLYVGGKFLNAGGVAAADMIAKWDGSSWSALGSGLSSSYSHVMSIISSSEGLYVGGFFIDPSFTLTNLARWNGSSWYPVGTGAQVLNNGVNILLSSSAGLYAGGVFTNAGGVAAADTIAVWNGSAWNSLGIGISSTEVKDIITSSEGLYVVGNFASTIGGGTTLNNVARWNGSSWSALDSGLNNRANSIVSHSDGLYIGGLFSSNGSGNKKLNKLAYWNGSSFNYLGRTEKRNGVGLSTNEEVKKLKIINDTLFIGGQFAGTRVGPYIKDKKYDYSVEVYSSSTDTIVPSPQLIFNNFIPPLSTTGTQKQDLYLNTYNLKNELVLSEFYDINNVYIVNDGYIYEVDKKANNKPFFDKYEEFIKDFKPLTQKYGSIPEYKISNFIEEYIKKYNGNFNVTSIGEYLTLDGALQNNGFNNINNSYNNTQQLNTNIIFEKLNNNNQINLKLKVSAVKKLLPYKGFYPSERIVQLSNHFINSFLNPSQAKFISSYNSNLQFNSSLSNETPINQQILTLLQPLFAPGILLNTIKSSIAVDFPVFITKSVSYDSNQPPEFYTATGSFLINSVPYYTASKFINKEPNYRLPFEALIEFDSLIPNFFKNSDNNLYYLNPTHYSSDVITTGSNYSYVAYPSYNMGTGSGKSFEFIDATYKLAMHNFLAEIPNFFLNGKLTNIVSSPEYEFKGAIQGKRYYMDVVLERDSKYKEFITDPFYEAIKKTLDRHFDGTFMLPSTDSLYGPPVRYWQEVSASSLFSFGGPHNLFFKVLDTPAYAPYVPPYYYGKSIARLSFLANETRRYSLSEIQDNLEIEFINTEADALFLERSNVLLNNKTSFIDNYSNSPAYKQAMKLSSSINLTLKSEVKNATFDAINSTVNEVQNTNDKYYSWIIQTKFETPSINFSDSDLSENVGLKFINGFKNANTNIITGSCINLFKGLWTTYGTPISNGEGIKLYIQESFIETFNINSSTGSLIDLCGFASDEKKTIGVLSENKIVSEGVVMIPYTLEKNHGDALNSEYADTLPEILGENGYTNYYSRAGGPYYFKLDRQILNKVIGVSFDVNSKVTVEEIKAIVESNKVDQNNSIVKLVKAMTNFVIPPHLDWLRNKSIEPFVMYIVPFDVTLDKEDLSNIWQGLMPKPSHTGQIETKEISHPFTADEMFHAKKLPNDIKFKFFKVKQRANINYYKLTADSKDDTRFKFKFGNSKEAVIPEYSYNYPYDFFSIVELVNVESELSYFTDVSGSTG